MKKTTTLIICLLLIQFTFSAPEKSVEELISSIGKVESVPPTEEEPAKWSMHYRLLLSQLPSQEEEAVKVYPNPVNRKDLLNVSLKGTGKKQLSFYDITGKLIKEIQTEKNTYAFSVAELGVGVYILNVKSDSIQTTKKVIIR